MQNRMQVSSHYTPGSKKSSYFLLSIVGGLVFLLIQYNSILIKTNSICESATKLCTSTTTGLNKSARYLSKLPNKEFYMKILNLESPRCNNELDPLMNAEELTVTVNLLWAFLDLCDKYRIEVMLYGGSLLGSYRFHGILPWDDDVDLLLKESDMKLLETVLGNSSRDMQLTKTARWKVWNKTSCLIMPKKWCWPFLDLSFYRVRGKFIEDIAFGYNTWEPKYTYPVRFIFPLHKRPFMGRWISAPGDTLSFLGLDYGQTVYCGNMRYSHKFEHFRKSPALTVKCSSLGMTYPFVIRFPHSTGKSTVETIGHSSRGRGVLEALRYNDCLPIYTVLVEEPPDALNYDYSLIPLI